MSTEYSSLAKDIVRLIGGESNVNSVIHCATRLRFKLKDESKLDRDELKKLDGVLTLVEKGGQFQIVIGPHVGDVYEEVQSQLPNLASNEAPSEAATETASTGTASQQKKQGWVEICLAFIQSTVAPIVPVLAGAGMLKALLLIFGNIGLGWIDQSGSTYKILMAASNSIFFFLPLAIAASSAHTLKVPYINAMIIVGALMEPNFTGLMQNNGDIVEFFGLPVVMMKYAGSILPAVVATLVYAWLHKRLEKIIPANLSLFVVPLIELVIMVPLTAMVIGPFGVYVAQGLTILISWMSGTSGMIMGAVIGAGWTYLVILGIHLGVVPIMLNNLSTLGYDVIRAPIACATFAQGGVALGVFLRSRNKKTKTFALSCLMPMLFGGITEPIVYGLSIRYKKPMIAATIGGGIAGAFMGAMAVKVHAYIFPSIITLPAFFGETFVFYLIGITMAFVLTAIITYVMGIEEEPVA